MNETRYPKGSTALLFIDPYNDFLADGGKMWPAVSEVARSVDLHANLARVRAAVREANCCVSLTTIIFNIRKLVRLHHRCPMECRCGFCKLSAPKRQTETKAQ